MNLFALLLELWKDAQTTKRELAAISADRELALRQIREKYAVMRTMVERSYGERKSVIDHHFELIERGIQEGKADLLASGMTGLSEVVAASPLRQWPLLSWGTVTYTEASRVLPDTSVAR